MWKINLTYLLILLMFTGVINATQIKTRNMIDGVWYAYVYDADNLHLQFDNVRSESAVVNIFGKARWNNFLYITGNFKVKELIISFDRIFQSTKIYIMQLPSNIKDIGIIVPKNTKVINRTDKKIKILYY